MSDESSDSRSGRSPEPPTLGLAIAADFLLWGGLCIWSVSYLGLMGTGEQVAFWIGMALIVICFVGSMLEIGRLTRSEAFGYWGASIVFLGPAALLMWIGRNASPYDGWPILAARVITLLLIAVGGAMFIQGIPHLFWKIDDSEATDAAIGTSVSRAPSIELLIRIVVALISLVTAILALYQRTRP